MSLELLNLCHDLIEHAGDDAEAIAKAKAQIETLHSDGGLAKVIEEEAESHLGEIAVKVLLGAGIPFVGAELAGLAIDFYNKRNKEEGKDDAAV